MRPWRRALLAVAGIGSLAAGAIGPAPVKAAGDDLSPIPVLAYYYIWYDEASWDRAKRDLPLLGRYSSDDREVMRQHVRWAREAGIDGFIVSWKSTLPLDRRLEALMQVAGEESFKLAIIYQGLDFQRAPLPIGRIAADLDFFIDHYADDPVFDIFGAPMVIWSGTWEFSVDQLAGVTETRSQRAGCNWASQLAPRCLLLLSSERNADGVRRLAGLVDGNAYYWSSVNPDTFPGYEAKLAGMSDAVRAGDGLWIAPAAPGFDARMIGGETVVERGAGATLRRELEAAYASSPDAVGVISWNEFSENSHVEPSHEYGTTALDALAEVVGGRPPTLPELDSSQPDLPVAASLPADDTSARVAALALLVGVILISSYVVARRGRPAAPHG